MGIGETCEAHVKNIRLWVPGPIFVYPFGVDSEPSPKYQGPMYLGKPRSQFLLAENGWLRGKSSPGLVRSMGPGGQCLAAGERLSAGHHEQRDLKAEEFGSLGCKDLF